MSYTKLLGWSLTVGFIPSAVAHPFHDASNFQDSMLHPLLEANRVLVTDVVLLATAITMAILLGMRFFKFIKRTVAAQKTQRSRRPLR